MAKEGLTPKQQRFVEEYLIDLNATQAYLRAGYAASSTPQVTNSNATHLLESNSIREAIESAQAERSKRTQITQDMVLRELALLGFSNMSDYMEVNNLDGTAYLNLKNLTREQAAAISELQCETYQEREGDEFVPVKKSKIKLSDKRATLELIGKHLGMFIERKEISGPNGGAIEISNPEQRASRIAELLDAANTRGK